MLRLTKKTDYGLMAIRHLAVNAQVASAKDIADEYNIPLPLLAKILQKLTRTGLLKSLPGTNGGYRLARDARKISVLEVLRAIEGPIILASCFTAHGECDQTEKCTVREPLRKVHDAILQLLGAISIFDMSQPAAGGPEGSRGESHVREPASAFQVL